MGTTPCLDAMGHQMLMLPELDWLVPEQHREKLCYTDQVNYHEPTELGAGPVVMLRDKVQRREFRLFVESVELAEKHHSRQLALSTDCVAVNRSQMPTVPTVCLCFLLRYRQH